MRITETVAYCHKVPTRPLKVVAVEPLTGGRPVQAFYSTHYTDNGVDVLRDYTCRWSLEEAFQGSKQHLGFEEPQGWSRQAVLRTAPIAMLLYSLVVIWFTKIGRAAYKRPRWPWYKTRRWPSFADMLTTLKRECIREGLFAHVNSSKGFENLLNAVCAYAQVPP